MVTVVLLVTGPLITLVGLFACLKLAQRYIDRRIAGAQDAIQAELSALVEGKPCQSGALLNALARTFGAEAGRSAKASLMADLAHVSRAQHSAEADAQAEALGAQIPMLGGLLQGTKGKGKLFSNPLVQLALGALSGRSEPAAIPPSNGGGSVLPRLRKGG